MDPSWHFPTLQKHLVDVLARQPCFLPVNLVRALKSIHLPSALRTAISLSDLVSRACILPNSSSPPTACAIYILALEGEALGSLPNCTVLAKEFGKRFGVSGDIVMKRYKIIYEEVETWSNSVPWLREIAGADSGTDGKKKSAKLSKRTAVARMMKDVIVHQEGVWQARLRAQPTLEGASDDAMEEADVSSSNLGSNTRIDVQGDFCGDMPAAAASQQCPDHDDVRVLAGQRKRARGGDIEAVSQFLLSPADARGNDRHKRTRKGGTKILDTDKLAHFLTSDVPDFSRPPTRLQLLLSQKREDDITDEELFGEGELENVMRSDEERNVLMKAMDWARDGNDNRDDEGEGDDGSEGGHTAHARRRDRDRGGTTRVNMEALERLLAESEHDAATEATYYDEDKDWDDLANLYGMEEDFEGEIEMAE